MNKKENIFFWVFNIFNTIVIFFLSYLVIKRFSRVVVLKSYFVYSFLFFECFIFSFLLSFYLKSFLLYKKRIFGNLIKFKILNYLIINLLITFLIFTSFNYFYNFNIERRNNFYTINNNIENINQILDNFLIEEKEKLIKLSDFIYKQNINKKNLYLLSNFVAENLNQNLNNFKYINKSNEIILKNLNNDFENYVLENYLKIKKESEFNYDIIEYQNKFYILSYYNNVTLIYYPSNQELFKMNKYFYYINTAYKKEFNNFLYSPIANILIYISIFIPLIFIQIIISINYINKFNKPLTLLLKGFENLTYEEYKLIETKKSKDEIYYLIESFNSMQKELFRQRTLTTFRNQYESYKKITHKVAHEIKNPLTPINLSLQLILKKYPYNDDFKNYLEEKIKVALNHLNQIKEISEKLYFLDNIDESENETIDILEYFDNLIKKWSTDDVKIVLNNTIKENRDLIVIMNKNSFDSIFSNLIINSMEARKKDLEIEIILRNEENKVIVDYIDNGPGIPKEISSIVFEPFYTTKRHGTGLGLSIVKSLLNKYGHNIEIVYDRNIGVHFRIILNNKFE